MKPSTLIFFVTCLTGPAVDAAAVSQKESTHIRYSQFPSYEKRDTSDAHDLWKRKGGGRGGGGRTSGSSGSTGGRSSSSPSTGSSSGSGGGTRATNSGGVSSGGSGPKPAYGGGSVYAGGAKRPYSSGARVGAIAPFLMVGAVLAFWPFHYPYGAYMYPYNNPYHYYNASSQRNETRNVLCGCQQYEVCSCDEENNGTVKELVGDGSYDKMNRSVVNVADVNGTQTIVIDGTLPNGTTADSAAAKLLLTHAPWWPVVATLAAIVIWV